MLQGLLIGFSLGCISSSIYRRLTHKPMTGADIAPIGYPTRTAKVYEFPRKRANDA